MTKEERTINNVKRVCYIEFMADGIKARLQRFNLFNTKQEQKDVSLFCEGLSVGFVRFSCPAKWEVNVSAQSTSSIPTPKVSQFSLA